MIISKYLKRIRKVWQVESRLKAEEFVEKVAKIVEDNLKNNRIKNTILLIIIIVLLIQI
jgi:hypothetical protein